ncbi:MAG: cell wall-binding repeat-containing protein [Desulfitobacteriaceae bacterium]
MRKWLSKVLSLSLMMVLIGTVTMPLPAKAYAEAIPVQRISGEDRYQTARLIAENFANDKVNNVVLANGNNFPDALSASVLAGKLGAPILLVDSTPSSSNEAFSFIINHVNKSGTVYLMGGTGVISSDFIAELKQLGYSQFKQIGGADRYETSYLICQQIGAAPGTPLVIASGENFPDALAVSTFAARNGWPILLTASNSLSANMENYLSSNQPKTVYIVGGGGVVSFPVEARVKELAPSAQITRLGGSDRYDTATKIVKQFAPNPSVVYLASGNGFADALAGSVLAAHNGAPIVLVDSTTELPSPILSFLSQCRKTEIRALGGTGVVKDETAYRAVDAVNPLLDTLNVFVNATKEPEFVSGKLTLIVTKAYFSGDSLEVDTLISNGNSFTIYLKDMTLILSNHSGVIADAHFDNFNNSEIEANTYKPVHFTYPGTAVKNRNTRLNTWMTWIYPYHYSSK